MPLQYLPGFERFSLLSALLVVGSILNVGGCVSIDDYEAVQQDAQRLALQLQMEQRRSQELDGTVRQLNEKVRDLERAAQAALEEAARREREYKEIRDEFLAFKIPLEQRRVHSQRSRVREGVVSSEPHSGSSVTGMEQWLPQPEQVENSKQRLQEAMEEFRKLLDTK